MYLANPQSEPADTQALLQTQFSDTGITVSNRATGGGSSSLMNEMRGIDGNGAPFADRIKASAASIIIESHTLNDALGGETVDDYRQYLAQWAVAVRAAGKTPVLEEANPVCDGNHPQLAAYVQAMDDVAAQFNVSIVKQFDYLQTIPNYCSHLKAGFFPDDAIYAVKAQRQADALVPLVNKLLSAE